MGQNKLQCCREQEEDPPHPVSVSVSLTCRRSCQHRRLGNLFGFCDEMVSGDNKLPDICQSLHHAGEGRERRDKRREAVLTAIARKIADRFSIVLDILIMLGRSICTHRVRVESKLETREQKAETAVATFLAVAAAVDAACLIPLRRVAALFPLNAQTFHSLDVVPQRLPLQLAESALSVRSHLRASS